MNTPEQAALLAKHAPIYAPPFLVELFGLDPDKARCSYCVYQDTKDEDSDYNYTPFPCDVHKMAQLKDAEIAELRRDRNEWRTRFGELAIRLGRESDAVSEAVERIVSALEEDDRNPSDSISQICRDFQGNPFKKHMAAIALLRSRDWSAVRE